MAGKRGRGRILSPATIRSKKTQRAKDRRDKSVFIGDTHQRWARLKEQHGPLLSNSDWAARLLDAYESSSHQRIHLSSTPISPITVEENCVDPSARDFSTRYLAEETLPREHNYSQKPGGKENFIVEVHAADVRDDPYSQKATVDSYVLFEEEIQDESIE